VDRVRRAEETKRRQDEAEQARSVAEEARIRAYWEGLTPIEQEIHKNDALREGNTFLVAQYHRTRGNNAAAEATYLKAILDEHIRRILTAGTSSAAASSSTSSTPAAPPLPRTAARKPQRTLFS
jgi:hypothetical protein